jgi:hypothetical protein
LTSKFPSINTFIFNHNHIVNYLPSFGTLRSIQDLHYMQRYLYACWDIYIPTSKCSIPHHTIRYYSPSCIFKNTCHDCVPQCPMCRLQEVFCFAHPKLKDMLHVAPCSSKNLGIDEIWWLCWNRGRLLVLVVNQELQRPA